MSELGRTIGRQPSEIALEYMRNSPPTDLLSLAADLGIIVQYESMSGHAGKIERRLDGKRPQYVITINSDDPVNRQRFTLAHEIAHFIKHQKQLDAGGIVDNVMYRSLLPEQMEWEANRYAAQLLMPLSAMKKLWFEGLRDDVSFAERLGVSEHAASIRLGELRGSLSLMGK
jgi:Zn-dependent peptidase ImmA (M78 family)